MSGISGQPDPFSIVPLSPQVALAEPAASSTSAPTARRTVRVAWFQQQDYMETSADGTRYGYMLDYLELLAQYANWDYEFIDADGFSSAYAMVCDGQADVMGCVFPSDERRAQVAFPTLSMGTAATSLYVPEDSNLAFEDFASFDGMRVAVDTSENLLNLQQYAERKGFAVVGVLYETQAEVREAVIDGTVDAGVQGGYRDDSETRSIARYDPSPFYIVANKDDPALAEELDEGLADLKADNPLIDEELMARHSLAYGDAVTLTKDEQTFISSGTSVRVAVNKAWYPLESVDQGSGEFSGIVSSIFDEIASQTGLSFEYVQVENNAQANQMLRDGEVDINASAEYDLSDAQRQGVDSSHTYLTLPLVLASASTGDANTLAVPAFLTSAQEQYGDSYDIVTYQTVQDCLDAVLSGDVDKALINSYSAEYYKGESRYDSLQLSSIQQGSFSLCATVRRDADPAVLSILNKGIDAINDADMNDIIVSETMGTQTITVRSFFSRIPLWASITILAVLVAIIVSLSLLVYATIKRNKRISNLLYHDSLTSLSSYQGFLEEVERTVKGRSCHAYAIVSVDMDGFEKYNAFYGFTAGNQLLKDIGSVLSDGLQPGETCARTFADNFLMLASGSEISAMVQRISNLNERLRALRDARALSFSFGIYLIDDPTLPPALMCDHAFTAKRAIKGQVEMYYAFFDAGENARRVRCAQMVRDLSTALENDEFHAYYQPKCSPFTRKTIGAEALVRWIRDDGSICSPSEFVPVFEENGTICKVDLYMLEAVCRFLRQALDAGEPVVQVSSNFSYLHLRDECSPDNIIELVDSYGIPHELVQVEFTESSFIGPKEAMFRAIAMLHDAGFSVAMDDFGSGVSSLNTIGNFPFDVLKIDQAFLRGSFPHGRTKDILGAVIGFARNAGLSVVMEGVETEEQFIVLRAFRVDAIQGYYFSKPLPEEQFRARLASEYALRDDERI